MTARKAKPASSVAVQDTPSKAIERIVELVAGLSPGELEAVVVSLPIEARRRLAYLFSKQALWRASKAEQSALLMRLAVGRWDTAKAIADAVYDEIERYRASAWLFERNRPVPSDPRRALLHALLTLTGGAVPSVRTLRRLFASVANIPPSVGHVPVRLKKSKSQGSQG